MASRDISLTPRVEDTRDAYPVFIPIQFSCLKLNSILQIVWMRLRGSLRSQIN